MKLLLLVLFMVVWANVESFPHTTCDFDVTHNDDDLSEACQKIKKENGDMLQKVKEEAIQFEKFNNKLREFELKFKGNITNDDYWDAQMKLYNETSLHECYDPNHKGDFYDCIKDKRNQMMIKLDKLIAEKISKHK